MLLIIFIPGCVTVKGVPCKLPFIYKGKNFEKCTTYDSPNGQPWCPWEVIATIKSLNTKSVVVLPVFSLHVKICQTQYVGQPKK